MTGAQRGKTRETSLPLQIPVSGVSFSNAFCDLYPGKNRSLSKRAP